MTRKYRNLFQGNGGSVVKNLPANAGDVGDAGSIPGSGRSPGEENGNHSSIPTWKIPWTEEAGGYSPWSRKELDTTEPTERTVFKEITYVRYLIDCLSHE